MSNKDRMQYDFLCHNYMHTHMDLIQRIDQYSVVIFDYQFSFILMDTNDYEVEMFGDVFIDTLLREFLYWIKDNNRMVINLIKNR